MRFASQFAIICSVSLVSACGGDDGGFSSALSDQAAGRFNGSLRGLFVMDGKLVDLASGEVRVLVPEYNDGDIPLVTTTANGAEFIELQQRCEFVSSSLTTRDCLIFRDAQGTESFRYSLGWRLQSRLPEISPDGQLISVIDLDKQTLVIIDRAGNIIDHSRQRIADAVWTRDGSIVYSSGQSIYNISASQLGNPADDTLVQSFEENSGKPLHLSISPDARRIAFTLSTESSTASIRSTVWTINFDGSDPQPFARSQTGFENRVGWPQWSPDGQWILVRQITSPGSYGPGRAGTQTALKSDVANHELGAESTTQINLRAKCFRQPDCSAQEINVLGPNEAVWVASTGG